MPDPAPRTAYDFCRRVLERGELEPKLAAPLDASGRLLPLDPSGPPLELAGPARAKGLRMVGGREKLPRPGDLHDAAARRLCLARFAHHELMAVEYFAWAIVRWPALPAALRRGLLVALADEQRHCRLYLERLAALGGRFLRDDHSDYFWRHAPAIAASPHGPSAFLAAMGLTLEQANLDFTLTYRDAFTAAGDAESAAICQQVHDDEITHVALAAEWIVMLAPDPHAAPDADLARYEATVPFPLAASRAKGRRFERAPRERAGLSPAFIEHVRAARSTQERAPARAERPKLPWILPNLGAEEGRDWAAFPKQTQARVAGRLFALLFPRHARIVHPTANGRLADEPVERHWPPVLGEPAAEAVAPWLAADPNDSPDFPVAAPAEAWAWLHSPSLATSLPSIGATDSPSPFPRVAAPDPACVLRHHDKRFALESARALALHPAELDPLLVAFDPAELAPPDRFIARLEALLVRWPDWTGGRFTLKPRLGSSGRGRIAGETRADTAAVRGALARFAARGGALLEPWLERSFDLSVALVVPRAGEPRVLASFELLVSRSGVYRGHFGLLGADGAIHSDDPDDTRARREALALARRAQAGGFTGPCGVDAFRYRTNTNKPAIEAEAWRGAVELNARTTMGTVAWGLLERLRAARGAASFPADREGRSAFLFALLDGEAEATAKTIEVEAGPGAVALDLSSPASPESVRPTLFLATDRSALREAYRRRCGC